MKTKGLFPKPSFLTGVARLVDWFGSLNMYNYSNSPQEADYRASQSDWMAVGEDIRTAMAPYGRERNP